MCCVSCMCRAARLPSWQPPKQPRPMAVLWNAWTWLGVGSVTALAGAVFMAISLRGLRRHQCQTSPEYRELRAWFWVSVALMTEGVAVVVGGIVLLTIADGDTFIPHMTAIICAAAGMGLSFPPLRRAWKIFPSPND